MKKRDYTLWSKEELIKELKKIAKQKKYGIVWENKPEQVALLCKEKLPVLAEDKNKEIRADKTKPANILIEGDNYHALSVLNYTHKGKIDVIYIDPPYNTGNGEGFSYNDRLVDKEDDFRHSKWLSFMEKRLNLAKNLLRNNGVIFISIDDNEGAQLKLLCDEVFGETNLIDIFYIQVRYAEKSLNEKDDFQKLIEQVLVYAKNKHSFKPNKPKEIYNINKFCFSIIEKSKGQETEMGGKKVIIFKPKEYEVREEKQGNINLLKATWASGSILKGNTSGKFFNNYIEKRKTTDGLGVLYKVYGIGEDGLGYRYFTGPKKEGATKGLFYSGVPIGRRADLENNNISWKEKPIINFYDYSPDFGNIRHEGGVDFRSGKKPTKMLQNLINLHKNTKAIVLDFFAGSGSTGHSVLDLNREDNGSRKFILCTNNEGNICVDICYPRIKNVIKEIVKESDGKLIKNLSGNLKYFKTDFVDAKPTDRNKHKMVDKSTEMLCLKEDCFEEVMKGQSFRVFTDGRGKNLGIIYDDDGILPFKKEAKKQKKKFVVYVFSLDESAREEEFEDIADLVELKPIPAVILNVYKRIFR